MSSGRITFRRTIAALALASALVFGPAPASAAKARSSPGERQRLVSLTHDLEQNPLKPGAREDRTWALEWIVNAPDIVVNVCPEAMGDMVRSDYPFAGEIVLQNSFAMAAFLIEHPEAANDPVAQQMAGMEGALNAYRSILRDRPEAKSPTMEGLLQTQSQGALPDLVRRAWASCSAKR
jgi:hypothetical protein